MAENPDMSLVKSTEQLEDEATKLSSMEKKPLFYIDFTPRLITLPDFREKQKINIRYPLLSPFAFAHIFWDEANNELVYFLEEPVLDDSEREVLRLVQLALEEMINISYMKAAKANLVLKYLEESVQSILVELGTKISEETYKKLMYYIYRDSVGLNRIEPLLHDYYIEDIECNGVNYPVYIVHRKYENLRTNITYKEQAVLTNFVEKLAQKAGRYVSYARPILDGSLTDGSRVNATYTDDVTTRGPTFTIRKFSQDPWTPVHLVDYNTASPEAFAYLWLAIQHKFNIMVVGETASGKTTFLNSLMTFIPPEARICSIEDTRELNLWHSNWLPAVTRLGFGIPNLLGERYGEITLFDLLKETFRQNPDYVILGETRGKETSVLFQGMASGHPSYSTFHAASVETLVRRLETPPIDLSPSLIETLDIICVMTHVKDQERNVRRLKDVQEILSVRPGNRVESNTVFQWIPGNDQLTFSGKSHIIHRISQRSGKTTDMLNKELEKRAALLRKVHELKIFDFKKFSQVIKGYYLNSDSVLKQLGVKL